MLSSRNLVVRTAALFALPALLAATDTPQGPAPPRARLLTIGRAYTIEAEGCETRNSHFRVTAVWPIDFTRAEPGQVLSGVFFRPREGTGTAGWRNVGFSPEGRAIEFDLFAQGGGTMERESGRQARCASPSPSRVVVDIEAWVRD